MHAWPEEGDDEAKQRLYDGEDDQDQVTAPAPEESPKAEQHQTRDGGDEEEPGNVVAVCGAAADQARGEQVPQEPEQEEHGDEPEPSGACGRRRSSVGGAGVGVHSRSELYLDAV